MQTLKASPQIEVKVEGERTFIFPLSTILMNISRFSIPKEYQKDLFSMSLMLQQQQLLSHVFGRFTKQKSDKAEAYQKQRQEELQAMVKEYWKEHPQNVNVYVKGDRTVLEIDERKYESTTEPEIEWVKIFEKYYLESSNIRLIQPKRGHFYYRILKTSTGDILLLRAVQTGELVEGGKTIETSYGEMTMHLEEELDAKTFYENTDEHLGLAMKLLTAPEAAAPSKLDPQYYSQMMDDYEYVHRGTHDKMVENILPQLQGKIIVPGDGRGRWAAKWKGEGDFTDLYVSDATHEKVKQESIASVLHRIQGSKDTLVLMFVMCFIDEEQRNMLKEYVKQGGKIVIIDTTDFPEELLPSMRQVNNMVYESGYPEMRLGAFQHDTIMTDTGIKYSKTLMSIRNPIWTEKSGVNKEYYMFMRPFDKPIGEPVLIISSLREYLLEIVSKKYAHQYYCTFIGSFDAKVLQFSAVRRISTRTIYRAPKGMFPCLPPQVQKEIYGQEVYFTYTEAESKDLIFNGRSPSFEYCELKLRFHGQEDTTFEWTAEMILAQLFRMTTDKTEYSKEQILEEAKNRQFYGTWDDLKEEIENNPRIEQVEDAGVTLYKVKQKRPQRKAEEKRYLSEIPLFLNWARDQKEFLFLNYEQLDDLAAEADYNKERMIQLVKDYGNGGQVTCEDTGW